MSPLERRCRLVLRAYPAGYRLERGDEIIATLLEATPHGRRRPLARDAWALIMGGLHARAAHNRRFSTAVNLRHAVLAGVSIYLGLTVVSYLSEFDAGLATRVPPMGPAGWPALLAGLLTAAVVVLAWLARRPLVTGAAAAAAAAASYVSLGVYPSDTTPAWASSESIDLYAREDTVAFVVLLVCLAAAAVLAGGIERPSPAWLRLTGVVVAAMILEGFTNPGQYDLWYVAPGLQLCVVVAVAWGAIDARPLVAAATYLLLLWVPRMLSPFNGAGVHWSFSPAVLASAAIATLAVWWLRRQSLRPGQPVQ